MFVLDLLFFFILSPALAMVLAKESTEINDWMMPDIITAMS